MKVSVGTMVGFVVGFGLFLFAVIANTTNYLMFVSFSSLLLVLGGTVAATFVSYQEHQVTGALKDMTLILMASRISQQSLFDDVKRIIEWANVARREGLHALEETLHEVSAGDTYLAVSARLLISNYKTTELRTLLERTRDTDHERSMIHVSVLDHMAMVAPAFGMVGTLVGMMVMLDNLEGDLGAIGGGLAVSLLTTLYGVLLAQLAFKPAAAKVTQKYSQTRFRNTMILEGLLLLAEGTSPARIEDSLNSFLDPELYFSVADRIALQKKLEIPGVNTA